MLDVPDLTLSKVAYGRHEIQRDLRVLLYRGSAKAPLREVAALIKAGKLGLPVGERITLVVRLHEKINADLVAGGAKATAFDRVSRIWTFFAWAEESGNPLTLEEIETTYRRYVDNLLERIRLGLIQENSAVTEAATISKLLDDVLNRSRPLITTTRLKLSKSSPSVVGVAADKQSLADTFAFGHFLLDIIDCTSTTAIWGSLPLKIELRSGKVLEKWSHLRDPKTLAVFRSDSKNKNQAEAAIVQRAAWQADCTLRTRYPLVNLRIMAELLVFISQTGMNLSQAHQLKFSKFSYKSTIDGYEVRDYKQRRKGEVLFEIFSGYKVVFDCYLAWRMEVFANDPTDYLFPFVRTGGREISTQPDFKSFRGFCKNAGIPYVGPQRLRSTRVNWMLRRSRDPDQTAEQAQHTKQTLLRIYEKPSLQVAMVEMIRFWQEVDPSLRNNPQRCPAPGVCDGQPEPRSKLPPEAPKPDCNHPSGCLFCEHHRDIDSEDYVWSAASMRHFKTIVLSSFLPAAKGKPDPARNLELVIEVLTSKLKWFKESNETRLVWVKEALARIEERDFHPHWRYLIESTERV